MAGSLNHIVDEETGEFSMDLIENLGDAHEALEECFYIIKHLTGGHRHKVNVVLENLCYPTIYHSMTSSKEEDSEETKGQKMHKFRKDDKVISYGFGEGTVVASEDPVDFCLPVKVKFDIGVTRVFTVDGKYSTDAIHQDLYLADEYPPNLPSAAWLPKYQPLLVWNTIADNKFYRVFSNFNAEGLVECFEDNGEVYTWSNYEVLPFGEDI